jgi:cyclase
MSVKNVQKIGTRGVIFTFADDISVYLLCADRHWFLCDTHLGPLSMDYIKQYIASRADGRQTIVFNSHSDWDHVWGNCAFQEGIIIGHELCRQRLHEIGRHELVNLAGYHQGNVELVLPNVTFSDKMAFAAEQVEFWHAPGHTVDSAVCFDKRDAVLFVGDLVEYPIPYLDWDDLALYINTLEHLKNWPAKVMVSAHSGIITRELIDNNIAYIRAMLTGQTVNPAIYRECPAVHNFNVNNRLFLQYEKIAREKLGTSFDYAVFRGNFRDLKEIGREELQTAWQRYYSRL